MSTAQDFAAGKGTVADAARCWDEGILQTDRLPVPFQLYSIMSVLA